MPISVAVLDLDGLKAVNDQNGDHAAGDKIIQELAGELARSCRRDDLVCRWGGDEFVMLLNHTTAAEAEVAIRRLRGRLAGRVSFSFGVAEWDGKSPLETLVAEADGNMYAEKRARKG
jgi:diguanylate cyclase (GGDEF)-like protein